jgi:hypothetical protein
VFVRGGADDLAGHRARPPGVDIDEQQLLLHAHCPHGGSLPDLLRSAARGHPSFSGWGRQAAA